MAPMRFLPHFLVWFPSVLIHLSKLEETEILSLREHVRNTCNMYCIVSLDNDCEPLPVTHTKLVDVLMKTYTSEAVFLLTTFVNMARSRTAVNDEERCCSSTQSHERSLWYAMM